MNFLYLSSFALLVVVGYSLGKRKNLKLLLHTGKSLEAILKPEDQTYTSLGGSIGFRANYQCSEFEKVEATLTLLPRQSPLYYPVSFLVSGFDRLYVTFFLKNKLNSEGHIINKRYMKYRGPRIDKSDRLKKENHDSFMILFNNDDIKNRLTALFKELEQGGWLGIIKHIAIVPDRSTIFLLVKPKSELWIGFVKRIRAFAREQDKF